MSNGFDSVTISAMKLCAARHDPGLAAEFGMSDSTIYSIVTNKVD